MNKKAKFKEMIVEEFLSSLSSDSPTPGGGTVSALAGALSSSLLQMVCSITLKKTASAELENLREKAREWEKELLELMDLDSTAFDGVISAFSLPKNTEEEKEFRAKRIQEAYKEASEIPLKTTKFCHSLLQELLNIKDKINPNVSSDWKVAVLLAFSGMMGGMSNVEINLPSIKDEEFKSKMNREMVEIKKETESIIQEILKDYKL